MNRVILSNQIEMPAIGLGTFPLNGRRLAWVTFWALRMGYRSFDTSSAYFNEVWLGRGLRYGGVRRKNIFLTSKLSNDAQCKGDVKQAFEETITKLGVDYLDLYLIHWPVPEHFCDSWLQMVDLYKSGKIRAIGVANFHRHHLEKLLTVSDVVPMVNQVELHPLLSQQDLVAYCKSLGIQMEAYSPIARMNEKLISNPVLTELAAKYKKSVVQIILRWDVQHGIIPIPKTSSIKRLYHNCNIFNFQLSDAEMDMIDGINENFRVRYDPDNCDFSKL